MSFYAAYAAIACFVNYFCDLDDPQSRELSEKIDKLSFSPWHATEDHKPLGNVMRARRVAYEASAALRGQRPEPTSLQL